MENLNNPTNPPRNTPRPGETQEQCDARVQKEKEEAAKRARGL